MNSPTIALSWQFWRRGMVSFTLAFLLSCLFLIFLQHITRVSMDLSSFDPGIFILFLFNPAVAAAACIADDGIQQRFILPMSSRHLAIVPLFHTMICALTLFLLVTGFTYLIFNAEWPLMKPAIYVVSITAFSYSLASAFNLSINLRAGIAAMSSMVLVAPIYHFSVHSTEIRSSGGVDRFNLWTTMNVTEWIASGLLLVIAFVITTHGYSRIRRGRALPLANAILQMVDKHKVVASDPKRFQGARSAQLWSEGRTRGWVMPAMAAMAGPWFSLLIGIGLIKGFDTSNELAGLVVGVLLMFVVAGFFFGQYMAHDGPDYEYAASRPVSDSDIADVKLLTVLRSIFWAWVGLFVYAMLMVSAYSLGSGVFEVDDLSANTRHEPGLLLLARYVAEAKEVGIIRFLALPTCLLIVIHWSLTSLGSMLAIAGRWVTYLVLFILAMIGIAASTPENPFSAAVLNILSWVIIPLSIPGTVFLFYRSAQLKLISTDRITVVSLAYVTLVILSFTYTGWLHSIFEGFNVSLMTLLALCLLPFAAIGGTPLAVRWNRHR